MPKQKHSKAYHRYFENYAEKQTMDASGKPVIQRVYIGQYYRIDLQDDAVRRGKILILLCFLGAAAGFLYAGISAPVSAARFPAIATALSLVALILLGISVFFRLSVPREMIIRQYRDSSERLRLVSAASAVILFLSAVVWILTALLSGDYDLSENLPGFLALAAAAGLSFWIHRIERGTPYTVLPPKNRRPEESSPIRYYAPD